MEGLVNEIVQKTGLTREQASNAAKAGVDFLKERLPSGTGSSIDGVLARETIGETVGSIASKIKGVFR